MRLSSSISLIVVVVAALGIACRESKLEGSAPIEAPKPVVVPAPAPAPPPAAPEPGITPAAAEALVKRWADAQNAGDFAGYEGVYARRFTGIKRVGEKTTRFDRAGWLRDRKGMFERGFRIELGEVAARSVGATAIVTFDQAFRSQKFSDRGPKQLVLAVEDGTAKIAREELLRSEVTPKLSELTITDEDFAFIRTIEGRSFWISRVSPAGQTIDGGPELIANGAAFGKVATERLPQELQALAGSTVVIDPLPEGGCEARLEQFGVVVDFHPHFGDEQRWDGFMGQPALPKAKVAREVFGPNEVTGPDHKYAVDITAAAKSCKSATWARAKSRPAVPVFPLEVLAGPKLEALRASVRKTPSYADLQKSYRESAPEGQWDVVTNATFQAYETRVGPSRFAMATLSHIADCASFSGEMTAVWRVHGDAFKSLTVHVQGAFVPVRAIDLDGDGMPEWMSETELLGWDGTSYTPVVSVKPSDYDCPC